MKIISVEEHIQSPALAKAMMPEMLKKAPFLLDWGKDVTDKITDLSRPQVIVSRDSTAKLMEVGDGRIAEMDEHGIDMQMLSYAGLPQLVQGEAGVQAIRDANDYLIEKVRSNPSRFGGFAYLPWQDVNAAIVEIERVHQQGIKAVLINGRPSEKWLEHADYEPVLLKLNDLEMPLFLHPGLPFEQVQQSYYTGFSREVSARFSMFAWGWHNEAGIQLIRMILAGVFDKFPKLNVIMGHWGELVPYYLQRLDDSIPQEATGLKRTIVQTFQEQVYVTPSGMMSNSHFAFNQALVGVDRILFSVDYPYLSLNGARAWLENLPISQEDKEKIAYKNAEKLFKL
ncbi:amidohydrolase family protein [Actinobacillus capsulatus]|uniref:amidohydrolase family protein n=1 Tax=Actinobacillus capsulatus TaxID=717 RepID=UPI000477D824|nr:amidohydrolase family protein [Actinobacillus capsulatus]